MAQPQILVNHISFYLPNGKVIFNDLTVAIAHYKTGLVGRNGIGKSTLLKLIIGELSPTKGSIQVDGNLNFVPQNFVLPEDITVAGFLECDEKINALHRIASGNVEEKDFILLNDGWDIEQHLKKWLDIFGLSHIPYDRHVLISG